MKTKRPRIAAASGRTTAWSAKFVIAAEALSSLNGIRASACERVVAGQDHGHSAPVRELKADAPGPWRALGATLLSRREQFSGSCGVLPARRRAGARAATE